jgi:hypothetical protein
MHIAIFIALLAGSSALSPTDISERVQPDLDNFIFCVLDESVAKLPSQDSSEAIASSSADYCSKQLDLLENAVAAQYRDVNRDVWPDGLAEQVAHENRDEYRSLAIKSAIKVIDDRRASP